MRLCFAIAFLALVAAIFIIFKVDSDFIENLFPLKRRDKKTLKKIVSKKKPSKLIISFRNIVMALDTMGQLHKLYYIILASFLLILFGAFTGITFGNVYIAIAVAIMLASLPFVYVRIQYIEYKALLLEEMESALSVITSSIERTDNILLSFNENIDNIGEPVQSIFRRFIYAVENNMPMADAIEDMKQRIQNNVFVDWCDNLKKIEKNRALKTTLRPIVDRITNIQIASLEAKGILHEASNEFVGVMLFSLFFMLVSYIAIPAFYQGVGADGLSSNLLSFLFAGDILMLFLFSIRTFYLTKDIDFDNMRGAEFN